MVTGFGTILLADETEELEEFFSPMFDKLALDPSGADDRTAKSVYRSKLKHDSYDYRVCRIHFYYFKIENGKLIARHYKYAEPDADTAKWTNFRHEIITPAESHIAPSKSINEALNLLLSNARRSLGAQNPKPTPDVRAVSFKERSFLAFCFDHDGWTFPIDPRLGMGFPSLPSVYFTETDGFTPNHSFFDGRTAVDITGGGTPRPIFYMVNHAKKNGNDDELAHGDSQPLKFNVVVNVPVSPTGNEKLTVIFDPGGNNLGPPDAPPP